MNAIKPFRILGALIAAAVLALAYCYFTFTKEPICIIQTNETPLIVAINNGADFIKIKTIIDRGEDINFEVRRKKTTPLIAALSNNRYDVADYLVFKGIDLNSPSPSSKSTPLNVFAEKCDRKAIGWLIKNGADVNLEATNGLPLRNIINRTKCGAPDCAEKCFAAAKLLIAHGAVVNRKKKHTLLQEAAIMCDAKMVKLLLDNGASHDAPDAQAPPEPICDEVNALLKNKK